MSHLSTIIERVERRAVHEDRAQDSLFEQAIINLMELVDDKNWQPEITTDELEKAVSLYDKYRPKLSGKLMSSHKERLRKSDEIREDIKFGIIKAGKV